MRVAAYCRVSTDKTDQLNSLETQKRFFQEYTTRTSDTLVRLYADEGISGTKTRNRKEFLKMLEDAEQGKFEMLLVKDISRLARNTVDLLQSVRRLKELGIDTLFLTANMTSMGNSEFILTIFGAMAQEESANTSKRIKFGKKANAERGRVPNLVYGYDKIIGDYFNLRINHSEAAVIRRIYDMYLREGFGASKIARILNSQGYRTKRDCEWTQNAICRILTNPIYIGKVINGRVEVKDFLTGKRVNKDESEWMITENADLRIIDDESFYEAAQVMQKRRDLFVSCGERHSSKHLFSTLIKCKECGHTFRQSVRKYKNTYIKWLCTERNLKGVDACDNATVIDEDELIDCLQEYFDDLFINKKEKIEYMVKEFQSIYKQEDETENYVDEIKTKLAALKRKRDKFMNMYADDLISREELNEKIGGMKSEIARLEKDLQLANANITKGEMLTSIFNDTFKQMETIPKVREMTNEQLRRMVDKIEVGKDGSVDINLKLTKELGLDKTVLIRNSIT